MADSTPDPNVGSRPPVPTPGEGSASYAPSEQPVREGGAARARYRPPADGAADGHALRDSALDREVLVRTATPEDADALVQEGRFLARLDHIGAPGVLDLVRDDAGALLVLRRTGGITLAEAIAQARTGQVPGELATPATVVRTLLKVCDIIARAHAQGVVHHALAPEAILLGGHGQVVLQDWSAAIAERRNPATLRYVSSTTAPKVASLGLDGLHDDIRGLGACLAESLLFRPVDRAAADPLGHLTPAERQRLPAPLESVIRQALAAGVSSGYQGVADLVHDLARYCDGLAPGAHAPGALDHAGEWLRRRRGPLLLAVAAGVLIAVAVGLVWGRQLRALGAWQVVVAEDFADPAWKQRWIEPPSRRGMFAVTGGKAVSTAERDAFLIFRQRLSTPVAIEYTGEIQAGSLPCDLSVQWSEASGVAEDPALFAQEGRSYMIQSGAFGNSFCAIFQNPGRRLLALANRQLETGRPYRFRVELDGTRISLRIDGELVLEHEDVFPTQSGFISLYGFYPGKAFSGVRVLQGRPANGPTLLTGGDTAFLERRYEAAAGQYARVAEQSPGLPIGEQALYRKGLAEWNLGAVERAGRDWKLVSDPEIVAQIDCVRLGSLLDGDQRAPHDSRFEEQYRDRPERRERLRQTWMMLVQQQLDSPQRGVGMIASFLDLRERLFPADEACRYVAAIALISLRRYEEVLAKFPDQRNPCARAMLALGRSRQIIETTWVGADERVHALSMRGDFAAVLAIQGLFPAARIRSLIHAGRAEEVLGEEGGTHSALLHLGRAGEALEAPRVKGPAANEALICLGRLAEAAGAGLPGVPGSGSDVTAMLMLGRADLAELATRQPRPAIRFMQAAESGNDQDFAAFHDQISLPPDLAGATGWFAPLVMRPFVDVLRGDRTAFATQTAPLLDLLSGTYGRSGWYVARAVLGETPAATVLEMPCRDEAAAWHLVAAGIRAELDGQREAALASYAAFRALPMHQRLLAVNVPDAEVEWFVAWRARALDGKAP